MGAQVGIVWIITVGHPRERGGRYATSATNSESPPSADYDLRRSNGGRVVAGDAHRAIRINPAGRDDAADRIDHSSCFRQFYVDANCFDLALPHNKCRVLQSAGRSHGFNRRASVSHRRFLPGGHMELQDSQSQDQAQFANW
jgi:hypothetical protein